MFGSFQRGKYFTLLAGLIALGALYPILDMGPLGLVVWNLGLWLVVLGGLQAVRSHRRDRVVAIVLAVLIVGSGIVRLSVGEHSRLLVGTTYGLQVVYFLFTTGVMTVDVFRGRVVTADKLIGAICVYLMMGVTWSFLYALVSTIHPGSLVSDGAPLGHTAGELSIYLYHSFVTLTTLGYGDLAPRSAPMRLLCSIEAVVGQVYLTVLVARLVGLHIVAGTRTP